MTTWCQRNVSPNPCPTCLVGAMRMRKTAFHEGLILGLSIGAALLLVAASLVPLVWR